MAGPEGSNNTDLRLRSAMDDVNIVRVTQGASAGGPASLSTTAGRHMKHPETELEVQEIKVRVQRLEALLRIKQAELDHTSDTLMAYKKLLHESESAEAHSETKALSTASPVDLTESTETPPQNQDQTESSRDKAEVNLEVFVQVDGRVPKSNLEFTLRAADCGTLDAFRTNMISAGSKERKLQEATLWKDDNLLRLVRDLYRVTYRLEEDGHVARMNITPTKVDRYCAFPETEYEAWFYRNIVRGNRKSYRVDVKIQV